MTRDSLAAVLGVRRPSVSVATGMLQQAGLIRYRRGHMRILDREGLRETACDDYDRTQEIYERYFPGMDGAGSPE